MKAFFSGSLTPECAMERNTKTILPHQCRAARGFLDMTRRELAEASHVSERTTASFESTSSRQITTANNLALRRTFEARGIGFRDLGIFPTNDNVAGEVSDR